MGDIRGLVALLVVAIGFVAAFAWYQADLETTGRLAIGDEVVVDGPGTRTIEGEVRDTGLRCSVDGGGRWLTDDGEPLYFALTVSSSSPTTACEATDGERLRRSLLVAAIGVLAGVLVLVAGRAGSNRASADSLEARAAAVAATGRTTSPPGDASESQPT